MEIYIEPINFAVEQVRRIGGTVLNVIDSNLRKLTGNDETLPGDDSDRVVIDMFEWRANRDSRAVAGEALNRIQK